MSVDAAAGPQIDPGGIDLSDRDFWVCPPAERHAVFDVLRRESPFAFFAEPEVPMLESGPGYYAVTRYADLDAISSQPAVSAPARARCPSPTSRPTSTSSTAR